MAQLPADFEASPTYQETVAEARAFDAKDPRDQRVKLFENVRSLALRADNSLAKYHARVQSAPVAMGDDYVSEGIHATLDVPYDLLTGRTAEFKIRLVLRTTGANASDTWRARVRLGGLTGLVIFDTSTWDLEADKTLYATIEGQITWVPADPSACLVKCVTRWDNVLATPANGNLYEVYDGELDLSGGADITCVLTALCSAEEEANIVRADLFDLQIVSPSDHLLTLG